MVAGLFGPACWDHVSATHPASAWGLASATTMAVPSDDEGDLSDDTEDGRAYADSADGPVVLDPAYRQLFGSAPVEDAVLRMFCQAAKLNNLLFGDNKADSTVTTDAEAQEMATLAKELVDTMQVLLGAVHSTKLHRLAYHLLQELRNRGNLWEGDTSVNESRHASVKAMFRRSNKSGATMLLQMLRADETQSEVLRLHEAFEREAERDAARVASAEIAATTANDTEEQDPETSERLRSSRRGITVSLAAISQRPGLLGLTAALGVPLNSSAVMVNTIMKQAVFEWGAPGEVQFVRGAVRFRGAPWFSFIRYKGEGGQTRWGMVNVVLRSIEGVDRPCVVVQRMRPAAPRSGCVLTEFGCQRLAWEFASPADDWPRLEAVEHSDILRLEQVHIDWQHLVGRHGVFAMPSTQPRTAAERRATRFFTNVFYPWTTRPQQIL